MIEEVPAEEDPLVEEKEPFVKEEDLPGNTEKKEKLSMKDGAGNPKGSSSVQHRGKSKS